jgi:uncharacterized protein with PhoU and TrkA domain
MENELGNLIIKMKDTSELMVDLAYSALFYNSKELAEEVAKLENAIDELYEKVQTLALEKAIKNNNKELALIMIKLATSAETIADAAIEIADTVLRGIEPHPIIESSILESDAIVVRTEVTKGSILINKSLAETKLASRTGMWVFVIKRGDKFILGPDANIVIKEKDILFVRGPRESKSSFIKIALGKKKKI